MGLSEDLTDSVLSVEKDRSGGFPRTCDFTLSAIPALSVGQFLFHRLSKITSHIQALDAVITALVAFQDYQVHNFCEVISLDMLQHMHVCKLQPLHAQSALACLQQSG